MKYSLLLPLVVSLFFGTMDGRAQSLELGLHAGATITSRATADNAAATGEQGLVFGASATFDIAPPLRLQVEAQYARKGVTIATSGPAESIGDVYNLSYLEVPVNIRFDIGGPAFQVYALAGTNVGTLLAASREYNRTSDGGEDEKINEFITPVNLALELGGGIGYGLGAKTMLFADARYSFGMVKIEDGDQSILNRNSWTPRDLRIVSGIRFRL